MTVKLSHTERRILVVLQRRWRWCEGSSWESFDALAKEIHRTRKKTRDAVRRMQRKGVLHYNTMCNEDGVPNGSGYFLVPEWDQYEPPRKAISIDTRTPFQRKFDNMAAKYRERTP